MSGRKQNQLKLDLHPSWINQDFIEKLKSSDFQLIVRYFVINTPDKGTSARGVEIAEYGIADENDLF